jgi:hypothetical protein
MYVLVYREYRIYFGITKRRIYVNGKGVSCNRFWYNFLLCKEYVDFVIKYKTYKPAHS